MKSFYTIIGLGFKGFINFLKDLPGASNYAMRK